MTGHYYFTHAFFPHVTVLNFGLALARSRSREKKIARFCTKFIIFDSQRGAREREGETNIQTKNSVCFCNVSVWIINYSSKF